MCELPIKNPPIRISGECRNKEILDILRISPALMNQFRLGDIIDDYCVKCRRLTNHSIVSLVEDSAAKVRCRTCYHDHDYRHEQAPPTKKELKKAEAAAAAALAAANGTSPSEAESDTQAQAKTNSA